MQHSFTFITHSQWQHTIDTPRYFRGSIRSEQALDAVVVTNSAGEIVQHLITRGAREAEIFWQVQHADDYTFHFTSQSNVPTTVTLELRALALKSDQSVLFEENIISTQLAKMAQQIAHHDTQAEANFWAKVASTGTPLVEADEDGQTVVTFLYQGDASTHNVMVIGTPYDGQAYLTRLASSDIWFKSYVLPRSSRLSYRLAVNVPQLAEDDWIEQYFAAYSTLMLDPQNPHPTFGDDQSQFGAASTMTLPDAPSDSLTHNHHAPQGRIETLNYASDQLGNSRVVRIYHPHPVYTPHETSPLLLMFDGNDYLTKVPTPLILDNMIAQGIIEPIRAVLIDPPTPKLRAQELTPNAAYATFLATELMPWLCEHLAIHPTAENTILCGSSFGGLAAMHIAFQYPNQFGKVLSQSGSFWWSPDQATPASSEASPWFAEQVTQSPPHAIDIYMNAGLFEINPASHEILENNRTLADILQHQGYATTFETIACGHDYFSWRVTLAHGLAALLNPTR
ncbi:alpha/beta hydrolase [Vibrio furnissii]|uniref:alpha/beta hydrolase n=1 Tax=Vibrio furnissii TaxID=29494 RepID=UPI001EEABEE0|nr:alpha/beta hydrolase-fold protein [Vibrio furnissii]MCG6266378.1 DUF3327 domain-containing protein [Vibrio furnissii]